MIRRRVAAALAGLLLPLGLVGPAGADTYPGDVNGDGRVDFGDVQSLSEVRPDDTELADIVRNWGTSAPPAEVATTASLTLTPGDTTIRADWSLTVGTDGANGAILSRDGMASDTGSQVGWTSPNYVGTSGTLTFIALYNGQTYGITVQPTRDGVPVGTPTTKQATPAAPASEPPPAAPSRGPGPVDLSTQGTVRSATCSTLNTVLGSSAAGDTVAVAAGTCSSMTISRSVTGGTIRILPASGATVTLGTTTISGDGLDFRGINSNGRIAFVAGASGDFWRGGTHSRTSVVDGFYFNGALDHVTVEDVTVRNADSSFYLQGTSSGYPTYVTLQRYRSENVGQDHVFVSWGRYLTIRDFISSGHTDTGEHSDGIQIVGGKDMTIANGEITNPLALRDGAADRNDHGIMVNYTPGEGRVPERITVDGLDVHNQTSTGIAVAGVWGMTVRNTHGWENGRNGTGAYALVVDPDPGNVVSGWSESNDVWDRRSVCCTS